MTRRFRTVSRSLAVASVVLSTMPAVAHAANSDPTKSGASTAPASAVRKPQASTTAPPGANVPLLPGAGSKEPVNIDAAKLDYYDKEQKLIYTGDVVAVQGDSTLKASVLTIFLQKQDATGQGGATAPTAPGAAGAPGSGSSVKHMEAQGPVTLTSKDQIGTGDGATYDKAENRVYLNGNVTLSQGTNVTQGDRLIYDLTNGQAQVFSGATNGRVKSVFTPGSGTPGGQPGDAKAAAKKGEPGATKRKVPAGGKTAAGGKAAAGGQSAVGGKAATGGKTSPTSRSDATAEQ